MRRLVHFLLAMLLWAMLGSALAFGQDKTEYPEPPEWWTRLTPFEQFSLVKTRMGDVISEHHEIKPALQKYLDKYPLTGLGIGYEPAVRNGDSSTGVKVVSVWKSSSAARAGIRPGDWLVKINRYDVCSVLSLAGDGQGGKQKQSCMDNANDSFRSISTDRPSPIEVERDGQILEFMAVKEPGIGKELVLAIEQFTPDLDRALAVDKKVLNTMAEALPEMYDNLAKLYHYFVVLEKMRDFQAGIFLLISEEEKNLQLWEEK